MITQYLAMLGQCLAALLNCRDTARLKCTCRDTTKTPYINYRLQASNLHLPIPKTVRHLRFGGDENAVCVPLRVPKLHKHILTIEWPLKFNYCWILDVKNLPKNLQVFHVVWNEVWVPQEYALGHYGQRIVLLHPVQPKNFDDLVVAKLPKSVAALVMPDGRVWLQKG